MRLRDRSAMALLLFLGWRQSGEKSTQWCDEHQTYCPQVWYSPPRTRRPIS